MTVPPRGRDLIRGRVATALMFASYGIILGAWTSRIPAIKESIGLSDGQLSIGLLAFAAGAMAGMQLIGRVVDRFEPGRVMIVLAVADAALLLTPSIAASLLTLVLTLFAFGLTHGTLNIAMNASAVRVERAWASPIMSSFHAAYSIGGFVGAGIGGVCGFAGLSARTTFLAVAGLVVALALPAGRWVHIGPTPLPAGTNPDPAEGSVRTRRLAGIYLLGLLAFGCLVGEGAAADWSAVYVRDTLGSSAGFAAAAYAAFSVMMMVGRLAGDRLAARFGAVALVRGGALVAATGLGVALLVDRPAAGVVGFGLFGAGLSCIAPLVFSAAGSRNPDQAGRAIARVASLAWLGFLVGPIAIGAVAQVIGLSWALTIPVALAAFVALTAGALRPRPPTPGPRSSAQGPQSQAAHPSTPGPPPVPPRPRRPQSAKLSRDAPGSPPV